MSFLEFDAFGNLVPSAIWCLRQFDASQFDAFGNSESPTLMVFFSNLRSNQILNSRSGQIRVAIKFLQDQILNSRSGQICAAIKFLQDQILLIRAAIKLIRN